MAYQQSKPVLIERLVAALSYLTAGGIGLVWLLIGHFSKRSLRPFLQYHIWQSCFLAVAYFLFSHFLGLLLQLLSAIPFVNLIILQFTLYLNMPLIFSYSIIQLLVYGVVFYLAITSFQGQYTYLPWFSDVVKANVRS